MLVFLLWMLGIPVLYVGLIRGLAYVFAFAAEDEYTVSTLLRWAHWLGTGLGVLCLVCVTGELSLHYPLFTVCWLLGGGVLAGVRLRLHHLLPLESGWAKTQLWALGLASPLLLALALFSSEAVVFQNSVTTVEVDRSFALQEKEAYGQARFYRATYFFFDELVGEIQDHQPGIVSTGMYNRYWWSQVKVVILDPEAGTGQVFFSSSPSSAIPIRIREF